MFILSLCLKVMFIQSHIFSCNVIFVCFQVQYAEIRESDKKIHYNNYVNINITYTQMGNNYVLTLHKNYDLYFCG